MSEGSCKVLNKNAMCICASHSLAHPRSTPSATILPLLSEPVLKSFLFRSKATPRSCPHAHRTQPQPPRNSSVSKSIRFFSFHRFFWRDLLRLAHLFLTAVPAGQKTAGTNGETGPRNAAAPAARSGQGGAAEGAAAGGRTVVLPEYLQRTPTMPQPLMDPPSIVTVAPLATPRPTYLGLVSVQPLSSARPLTHFTGPCRAISQM
eukprot:COSAG04_NODE_8785_length_931_cov_45.381010_1_plen_205_part_00